MDDMEMVEAESNLNDLVSEYQQWNGCCQGIDEYDDYGDDNEGD